MGLDGEPPGHTFGMAQVVSFMPCKLCNSKNIFMEEPTPPKGVEGRMGFQNLATLQTGDPSTTKVLGVI